MRYPLEGSGSARGRWFTLAAGCGVLAALLACKNGGSSDAGGASSVTAAASVSAPTPPTEVSFQKSVPRAGTRSSVDRKVSTRFTYQGQVVREINAAVVDLEVQASDEFRINRAAIDVKEFYTVKQQGAGDEKKSVSPIAGARYVATRGDDGKLSALDASGNKVAANLLALIKDEFGSTFEPNQAGAFLPDRAVKIGEKLMPSSDAVLKMLSIKDDGSTTIDGIEFVLASGSPELATFDVTMTMTAKITPILRLRARLKGQFDLKPSGTWLTRVDLKGPIELIDNAGNNQGTGELTMVGSERFQ